MGVHELSALLWRERELLEVLQFKLEVEQLLLTTGNTRWLNRASAETPRQVTCRTGSTNQFILDDNVVAGAGPVARLRRASEHPPISSIRGNQYLPASRVV